MPVGQTGQNTWNNQGAGAPDYIVQAGLNRQIFMEMREQSVFTKLTTNVSPGRAEQPQTSGLPNGPVQAISLGDGETEARFTLERRLTGKPTYGDGPVRPGDYTAYQHQSVFANEIDSLAYPIPGRMSQLKARKVITDPKGSVKRNVVAWHAEQDEYDHIDALLFGASGNLIENIDGSERLDLGAGAATPVLPELMFVQNASGNNLDKISTQYSVTPRTTAYNNAATAAIAAANGGTKKYFDRKFVRALYDLGVGEKIKKVSGSDWDFVYVCDPAMIANLVKVDQSNNTLYAAYINSLAGDKNGKAFDYRGALVLDGILLLPSEYLAQYRTNGAATLATTAFGTASAGTYFADRRNTVSTSGVGFGFLLGDQALLRAERESIVLEERAGEDSFGKNWEAMGWTIRGLQRSYWRPQDGSTAAGIQQSSICVACPVNPSVNPFV